LRRQLKNTFRDTILALAGVLAVVGTAQAAADPQPGLGITVRPVVTGDLEVLFDIGIVNAGLERLGYTVAKPKTLSLALLYASVAQGDGDYAAETWWPGHKFVYENSGGAAKSTLVGTYMQGASQGYFIDKRTAEEFHITNIDQLKDPKIAALFAGRAGGKAELIGCEPGWGCERIIDHQLKAYDLTSTVTQVKGSAEILFANIISKYKNGDRVLYYTYTPLWVQQVLVPGKDVVPLAVPFTSLPQGAAEGDVSTLDSEGRNVGWITNTIKILGNNEFLAKNPAARRWLERVTVPTADVNRENYRIYQGEKSTADIERHVQEWLAAHKAQVDAWVAEAAATP